MRRRRETRIGGPLRPCGDLRIECLKTRESTRVCDTKCGGRTAKLKGFILLIHKDFLLLFQGSPRARVPPWKSPMASARADALAARHAIIGSADARANPLAAMLSSARGRLCCLER